MNGTFGCQMPFLRFFNEPHFFVFAFDLTTVLFSKMSRAWSNKLIGLPRKKLVVVVDVDSNVSSDFEQYKLLP